VSRNNDNVYLVLFKNGHKRFVNVDRLQRYHPYLDAEVATESPDGNVPPTLGREPPQRATDLPLSTIIMDSKGLREGDPCLLKVDDSQERLVVSRFLNTNRGTPNGTGFLFQWMGGYVCKDPIERLKIKWVNGWISPASNFYYWKPTRTHGSHEAYTNARTDHAVESAAILLAGFGLQADGKLPKKLMTIAEKLWTTRATDPSSAH
jgi:hypothetical protein